MSDCDKPDYKIEEIQKLFVHLNNCYLKSGLQLEHLKKQCFASKHNIYKFRFFLLSTITVLLAVFYRFDVQNTTINYLLGVRCVIRNNYFIWEATRPLSNCNFCTNITKPIVLPNLTSEEFAQYAYSSKPIIVKGAFLHWEAINKFSLQFFQELYSKIEDSFSSVDEECQFLHFKSDFISIKDVFDMTDTRMKNLPNETSWYVGWGNCHPQVLEELRKYYPKPHFLPPEAEIPSKDYVFMGYDDGATMHLDFINRLMWQAQLKGVKKWKLLPPPECEDVCQGLEFVAEPGDAVLVDTRVWYHGTTIAPGDFSLSIQSEYG